MVDVLRVLYHWKEVVRSVATVERAVYASAAVQCTQAATRCIARWSLAVHQQRGKRWVENLMCNFRRRSYARKTLKCFDRLRAYMTKQRTRRARVNRKLSKAAGSILRDLLADWTSTVKERNRWVGCTSFIVRRRNVREASLYFKNWSNNAAVTSNLYNAAHRTIQRGMKIRMQVCMMRWIRTWRIRAVRRRTVLLIRGKRQRSSAAATFDAWWTDTLNHRREIMEREEQERNKMGDDLQEELKTKRRDLITRKAVLRMHQKAIDHAWECWYARHCYRSRVHKQARRILQRWRSRNVAKVFSAWQLQSSITKYRDVKTVRIMLLWMKSTTAKAFRRWEEQAEQKYRLRLVASKIVERMTNRLQFRACSKWFDLVKRQRLICKAANSWIRLRAARLRDRRCQSGAYFGLSKTIKESEEVRPVESCQSLKTRKQWEYLIPSTHATRMESCFRGWHEVIVARAGGARFLQDFDKIVTLSTVRSTLSWSIRVWYDIAQKRTEVKLSMKIRRFQVLDRWRGTFSFWQRIIAVAFDKWLQRTIYRSILSVRVGRISRRLVRHAYGLRSKLQKWCRFTAQAMFQRMVYQKIHRYYIKSLGRQILFRWNEYIQMQRMSAHTRRSCRDRLMDKVFWIWWEVCSGEKVLRSQTSSVAAVNHFQDAFQTMLGQTLQGSASNDLRLFL